MKKTTFILILIASIALLLVAIIGAVNNKTGIIAVAPVCICVIFLANSLYEAGKNLDWYASYVKELETRIGELEKAITAKDQAIASYKWDIDSLKKKLMR